MKNFWKRLLQIRWILYCLIIFSSLCFLAGYIDLWELKDFWINLSAGFTTSIVIIIFIDFVIEQQKQKDRKEIVEIEWHDLKMLRTQLVTYMVSTFDLNASNYNIDKSKDLDDEAGKVATDLLTKITKRNIREELEVFRTDQWHNLLISSMLIKQNLDSNLNFYKDIHESTVLGKMLRVRVAFDKFYQTFSLVPELFTKQQQDWPENKGGTIKNKSIRDNTLLPSLADALEGYFKSLEELNDLILKETDYNHLRSSTPPII